MSNVVSLGLARIAAGEGTVFEAYCVKCSYRDILAFPVKDLALRLITCPGCGEAGHIIATGQLGAYAAFVNAMNARSDE